MDKIYTCAGCHCPLLENDKTIQYNLSYKDGEPDVVLYTCKDNDCILYVMEERWGNDKQLEDTSISSDGTYNENSISSESSEQSECDDLYTESECELPPLPPE